MTRIVNTLPVVDVDSSLWSVFVHGEGDEASVAIQVCSGFGVNRNDGKLHSHPYDGEWHEGDTHLFLDHENAVRFFHQLREAVGIRIAPRPS